MGGKFSCQIKHRGMSFLPFDSLAISQIILMGLEPDPCGLTWEYRIGAPFFPSNGEWNNFGPDSTGVAVLAFSSKNKKQS